MSGRPRGSGAGRAQGAGPGDGQAPAWREVGPPRGGERLDLYLVEHHPGASRRAVTRLFDEGRVRVNGRPARKGQRLAAGDVVTLAGAPATGDALHPSPQPELPLEVLHEDPDLIAVAKPAGWPSHPLRAGESGTLANALVARYPECAGAGEDPREAGLVHRLDAGTSGVLVAARRREAWRLLRADFHEGRVEKEYLALVVGEVTRPGAVDAPIAHDRADPRRVLVLEDPDEAARRGALPAITRYEPVERRGAFTLLRCRAETGRMHQVRAHLAHAGIPVVGDLTYGIRVAGEPSTIGHFLHASRLHLPRLGLTVSCLPTWGPGAGG